jgi:cation:H+ antiporter
MHPWVIFLVSAAAIIAAGRKLSQYGDDIAVSTGLGRAFVGALLLAGATSLPEVAASIVAATQGWGNLAMGNVFGSNIFNIAIIAVAQLFAPASILANASRSHSIVAVAGILLSGLAALAMLIRSPVMLLGAGADTWVILVVYLLILRLLPREEPGGAAGGTEAAPAPGGVGRLWGKFALAVLVVLVSGWFLTGSAEQIAEMTGLGQTFVGSTLLALATSLPELVVTIVSVQRGAYDLAMGNVLGSNIFNMLILVLADLALPGPQPLLSTAEPGQLLTALLGLVLSGLAVLGLSVRKRTFGWDAAAIAVTYLVGTWLLFTMR